MGKSVLLFSAGLDSWCAWRMLGHPDCLYFRLGHRYEAREREAISRLQVQARLAHLPQLVVDIECSLRLGASEQPNAHIPLRNLLIAACAAREADVVYLVALRGEASRDKSGRFFQEASALLSYLQNRPIRVEAPFRAFTKTQLVTRYLHTFPRPVDRDLLYATVSCYGLFDPVRYVGCGQCMACFRRWVAFQNNGLPPEVLAHAPTAWEAVQWEARDRWTHTLARTPFREWPGVIRNNLDAARALAAARKGA